MKTEGSQRDVILPPIVINALLAHRERQNQEREWAASDWVETGMMFTTRIGTMLEARNMLRDYYNLVTDAALPRIRFHDLRHSAATILRAAGLPIEAIQKLLGHRSSRTTQDVYAHVTPETEAAPAAAIESILDAGRTERAAESLI